MKCQVDIIMQASPLLILKLYNLILLEFLLTFSELVIQMEKIIISFVVNSKSSTLYSEHTDLNYFYKSD